MSSRILFNPCNKETVGVKLARQQSQTAVGHDDTRADGQHLIGQNAVVAKLFNARLKRNLSRIARLGKDRRYNLFILFWLQ